MSRGIFGGLDQLAEWQERIDRALPIAPDDLRKLEAGEASVDLLGRICRQIHSYVPWKSQPIWPWSSRHWVAPTVRTLEGAAQTYRFWWPTYGEIYDLRSTLLIEAADERGIILPRSMRGFLITGPVRGLLVAKHLIRLTLLPDSTFEEKPPGRPNPGDLIYEGSNILLPPADP